MPQPTRSDVHVDALLTSVSIAFMEAEERFVASRVFPVLPVPKQSDKYFVYNQGDFMRDQVQPRADGTESAGTGYGLSTSSYSADVFALHKDIGDQVRENANAPLNPDLDATRFLTQQMLIKQERQWASDYFTTSVWDTDSTPGTLWSASGSTPIADIQAGINTVLTNTGYVANTLVLSYAAYSILKNHSDFTDRYKYTTADSITAELMARVLELDNVYVTSAVYNSAAEGATNSFAQIGDKDALLCYVNPSPGLMVPSAGYTFAWSGISAGLGSNSAISRFRMDHLKADRIEIEAAWANNVVSSALGYFFSNPVA
jgi:hypothetical protein